MRPALVTAQVHPTAIHCEITFLCTSSAVAMVHCILESGGHKVKFHAGQTNNFENQGGPHINFINEQVKLKHAIKNISFI